MYGKNEHAPPNANETHFAALLKYLYNLGLVTVV